MTDERIRIEIHPPDKPSAYTVIGTQQARRDWLEKRRLGIGASDAAAILGVSRWATPTMVYADKAGYPEPIEEQSEAARWGQILEPVVAKEFANETGRMVTMQGELLRSNEREWQLCTLDARQAVEGREGPGVLEIKTSTLDSEWRDGVPAHVLIQVQHQLAVTGWGWGSVAALLGGYGGFKMRWMDFERDEALIAEIIEGEAEFWDRVCRGEPPPVDGHPGTTAALKRIYNEPEDVTIELGHDYLELDGRRAAIDEQMADLKAELEAVNNEFRAAMGNATVAVMPGATWTNRPNKNGVRSLRRRESDA
jgi:putative phage-type endonuclease